MKIKLNIQYIQNLTNNEAFTYFCTLVTIANNPDATIKDVVRTCGIGETTVFKHLKKFDELGYLVIDRTGTYNTYRYTEPDRLYITIDSDLLNINGNKNGTAEPERRIKILAAMPNRNVLVLKRDKGKIARSLPFA